MRSSIVALLVALSLATAFLAFGAPARRQFGPGIDDLAEYDGQSTCSPTAKPGVLAFQQVLLARHPKTGSLGISRACNIGGRSEHKEGRAWDWEVYRSIPAQRDIARAALDWLLRKDRFGHAHARARRFGIMYMIWNKRIWFPYGGWENYCTMRGDTCYGGDGTARSPHTNHVHFSFTWAGALGKTTWWKRKRSLVSDVMASSNGYRLAARNGSVLSYGARSYGARSDRSLVHAIAAAESTLSGDGYWLLASNGGVAAFGDAPRKRGAKHAGIRATGMAATPSGDGYWILSRGGRVFARGDARKLGNKNDGRSRWTSIASTPTGLGYWLFASDGRVAAMGDAVDFGDARNSRLAGSVTSGAAHGATGYWIATSEGALRASATLPISKA